MSKEEDWEAEAVGMSFRCPECIEYWRSTFKYWKGLGKDVPAILCCPICNHKIGRKLVW